MSHKSLNASELLRFQRQINLKSFGSRGQLQLKHAHVLLLGLGGLGQPCAQYLSAAGVGHLGLMDADYVEASNLHRQVLSTPDDIGLPKIEVVERYLIKQNPHVNLTLFFESITADSDAKRFADYDLIIDGTDNFKARYAACDVALKVERPLLHASILRESGLLALFAPVGPCYRCLYPEPPPPEAVPSCSEAGVLATTTGMFGTLMASKAIDYLIGEPGKLQTHLMQFNSKTLDLRWFKKPLEPNCPACQRREFHSLTQPEDKLCDLLPPHLIVTCNQALENFERYHWVDIRTAEERQLGFIKGSHHIPLDRLDQELAAMDSGKPIVLYCQSGQRSAKALMSLQREHNVCHLDKGYSAWLEYTARLNS